MERQLPKNVRQIGNVCDEPKIYVEDYVDIFLGQLQEKAMEKPVAAVLAGEITTCEDQTVVYISGAILVENVEVEGTELKNRDEIREKIEENQKEYFKDQQLIGWCLIEAGHPMSLNHEVQELHRKFYDMENTVFIWRDAETQDEMYFAYKYNELMQIAGHYIYYEKNPQMQNYMINTRRQNGVTPIEVVEDRAAKDFRSAVREKMEYKEQHQSSKFAYITSALLVLIVLVIGITTVNNFDKMKLVQTSLENLSKSMENGQTEEDTKTTTAAEAKEGAKEVSGTVKKSEEAKVSKEEESQLTDKDYYVVQKGETLAGISKKLYGDTSHVKAICKMNGLSDGNLIYIGQKLLLP